MLLSEIAEATNGVLVGDDVEVKSFTIDSRKEADFFVPLIGESLDGHDFIDSFFNGGGKACFSKKMIKGDGTYIRVEDTHVALKELAKYHRAKFCIPIVAITGSVGKTSTRQLVVDTLSVKFNVAQTMGNFNNDIGLPLSILNGLSEESEAGVFEIGMNHFGEIDELASILKPDYAIITNIGTAHIGNLGSQENILKAKFEIFNHISSMGIAILNGDDDLLSSHKSDIPCRIITYGIAGDLLDVRGEEIYQTDDGFSFEVLREEFEINLIGTHNLYNALAGYTIAKELGLDFDEIRAGLAKASNAEGRQNILELSDFVLIDDCYNASFDSMLSGLELLYKLGSGKKKIAVLGSMLELGEFSEELHIKLGEYIDSEIDLLITVGVEAKEITKTAKAKKTQKVLKASDVFNVIKDDLKKSVILVKGSNSIGLSEAVDKIKNIQ